jgi:nucleoside-diphosphate-sugar epimerase
MKIFVAGATGALGRLLVPRLVADGHAVTGMTRSSSKLDAIRSMGAAEAVADALDADAVREAVAVAQPDVIVHQLTALGDALGSRSYTKMMEPTNTLRIEGTDHLLAAARAAGVRGFVAQSYAGSGMPYARFGGPVKTEDDPVDSSPPADMRAAIDALRHLEDAVTGADWTDGIVLRYGGFYGPGTSMSPGGEHFELVRKRRMPVIGSGAGIWSFIHIEDAADATVAAIDLGRPGIYNIVDDEPAPVAAWLPAAAAAMDARPPRHLPRWLGRLIAGEGFTVMMTEVRGASNAKAKRELGWTPRHPTWREGFAEVARQAA